MKLILLSALAVSAPPDAPPVDRRLTDLENRVTALEAAQKKSTVADGTCPCGPNCPCCAACPGKQMPVVGATNVAPAPTYHYAPGTTCRIDNGAVVCGGQPIAVTYPDNPTVQVPLQQTMQYAQPSFSAPMFEGGGSCANGQCGGGNSGRRGLFGRRR
jgi:hypothetical protein